MIRSTQLTLVVVAVTFLYVTNCLAEMCPDQKMSCRKGQTCCDDKQGGYGCCPYDNATCCSDGLHCCPQGTQCELSAGRCKRKEGTIRQAMLVPISVFDINDSNDELEIENSLDENVPTVNVTLSLHKKKECPDGKSTCPSTYTCCADPEGSYACCPFPNGTCCSDKIHCCPNGQQCRNSQCV